MVGSLYNPHRTPKKRKAQEDLPEFDPKEDSPFSHYDVRESGTIVGWSTMAGNPSEFWLHGGTGAFRIVNKDGSKSEFWPGETKQEFEGLSITTEHNYDLNTGGILTVKTKGGLEAQISGEGHITIGGATVINILDDSAISVKGNALVTASGTVTLNGDGAMNLRSGGDFTIGSKGAINMQAGGGINLQPNGAGASGYKSEEFSPASGSFEG